MPPTPFTSQSSRLSVYRVEIAPRTLALLLGVVGGLWLALRLAPILLTLLVALILAGTLSPVVENLERRGISRTLGVAMVFTAALGVVVGPSSSGR
jgi:predicted PurR-regulated permease PerM